MSKEGIEQKGEPSRLPDATVQRFEASLKEIVNAKRLSASRMSNLTEMSLKLMEHDTQLVSILYRTHKSLPTTAKISSLYVFDSMCRAARTQVNKQKLTGDINSERGNAATFLLKIEGILDGLFQDVLASGLSEAKEKTKKVLDIWTKANTFPAGVLTRLADLGKEVDKEPKRTPSNLTRSTMTTDPRKQSTPPSVNTSATPPGPPPSASPASATSINDSAQAALLALLSSATAATANSQTAVNIPNGISPINSGAPSQPTLDPAKLLLQQLTSNAASAPVNTLHHQQATFIPPQPFVQYPTYPSSNAQTPINPSGPRRIDSGYNRFDGPSDGGYERTDFHEHQRKGFRREQNRDGPFAHGYGRDDRPMGRHEERDRYRREDDRGPIPNQRFNRSRSPTSRRNVNTRESRREVRPYSPPGRPSLASVGRDFGKRASPPKEHGKDEFGRDIRSPSQEPGSALEERTQSETRHPAEENLTRVSPQNSTPPILSPPGNQPSSSNSKSGGLESFNFSLFNPTDPVSWKALGEAFQMTNGYVPSQEELMEVIMTQMISMGMGMDSGLMGVPDQAMPEPSQNYGKTVEGLPRMESSDVGQAQRVMGHLDIPKTSEDDTIAAGSGSAGGQMRKVGDGWVFVRGDAQS